MSDTDNAPTPPSRRTWHFTGDIPAELMGTEYALLGRPIYADADFDTLWWQFGTDPQVLQSMTNEERCALGDALQRLRQVEFIDEIARERRIEEGDGRARHRLAHRLWTAKRQRDDALARVAALEADLETMRQRLLMRGLRPDFPEERS